MTLRPGLDPEHCINYLYHLTPIMLNGANQRPETDREGSGTNASSHMPFSRLEKR